MHALIEYMKEETVQVLTAGCVGQEFQLDKESKNSIFLNLLLGALQGDAFLSDCEWVTAQQLASWLQVEVAKDTGNAQFPQYDKRHRYASF